MSANAVRPVSPAYGTALAWPPDELAWQSERERAEEALRRSERERAEEALQAERERALLKEQLRLSQKLEAVGRLAGGIAHDFNNLLTVIMGSADLLLRRLDGDDRELVDEIGHAAERAAALTHQLLAFSRRQVLEPQVLDLNAAVSETTRMLGRLIGEHIELVARLDPALGSVRVDPSQLEQVIMNLTLNARDAMPAGGRLTIETANVDLDEPSAAPQFVIQPGRYVVLAVTDTGCGMDAETRARLFEPFFTTKEPGKGTGLGLATVYGVVKQSGGYIAAESEPGRGSAFRIYLPRVEGRTTEAPLGLVPSCSFDGSETILLAEDDDAVRRLVRRALEERGYTVLEAPDGRAALEIGERHGGPLDLLITDVVMPAMGGNEVAVQLTIRYPGLRVLYTSGYSGDYFQRGNPGVSPLLKKPFTLDSLVEKVRQVLDEG